MQKHSNPVRLRADEDERALLARCRDGDALAWEELFERHYAAVGRFVFQLASDFTHEDVEEVCQETFLAVIRSLGTFHGDSAFQTWVFRIAANRARDHRERRQAAKRGGGRAELSLEAGGDAQMELPLNVPSPAPGPDATLMRRERAEWVRSALDRVGEPCREIVELRYFGDLSYEELAVALQLNPKTVSSRLSKCLDKLEAIARRIFSGEKAGAFPSNP